MVVFFLLQRLNYSDRSNLQEGTESGPNCLCLSSPALPHRYFLWLVFSSSAKLLLLLHLLCSQSYVPTTVAHYLQSELFIEPDYKIAPPDMHAAGDRQAVVHAAAAEEEAPAAKFRRVASRNRMCMGLYSGTGRSGAGVVRENL